MLPTFYHFSMPARYTDWLLRTLPFSFHASIGGGVVKRLIILVGELALSKIVEAAQSPNLNDKFWGTCR